MSAFAILQAAAALIVVTWIVARVRREPTRGARARFLATLAVVAAASWAGEESCIRLYGFYAYAPSWAAFLDRVPLAIVCIWPVVVLSALDLARALVGAARDSRLAHAALVMLLVDADASLIEPIAVKAGLWSWTEAGPFSVPIVGVLGWGFFAFGVALVLGPRPAPSSPSPAPSPLPALVMGPLAAHALLLASWWAALRWLPRGDGGEVVCAALAWAVSLFLAWRAMRGPPRVTLGDLLLRVPAALFFFALLAVYARDDVALLAYAVAFAPPYLAMTWRATVAAAPRAPTSAATRT